MGIEGKIQDILSSNASRLLKGRASSVPLENDKATEEFNSILKNEIGKRHDESGIRFSIHAARRIKDRNLEIDNQEFVKLREGISRLKDKGGRDSLIITEKAAYIVDVDQRKIITAMGKNNLGDNVFTKIDSTLVIN